MSPDYIRLVVKAAAHFLNDGIVVLSVRDEDCQRRLRSDCRDLTQSELDELMELWFLAEQTEDRNWAISLRLAGKTHRLEIGRIPNARVIGGPPPNVLTCHPLTRMGHELCKLISTETNTEYLGWLAGT